MRNMPTIFSRLFADWPNKSQGRAVIQAWVDGERSFTRPVFKSKAITLANRNTQTAQQANHDSKQSNAARRKGGKKRACNRRLVLVLLFIS